MDTPITSSGKPCKKCISKGPGERCHLHKREKTPIERSPREYKTKKSRVKSPVLSPGSPMVLSPLEMEKEYRLGRESPGMGSLDWSPSKAKLYTKPERMAHLRKYSPENIKRSGLLDMPKDFLVVYEKLQSICSRISENGTCTFNPTFPGIQWDNRSDEFEKEKENWENDFREETLNHYVQNLRGNLNYPEYDRDYCMCHDWNHGSGGKIWKHAFETLKLPLQGEDKKWEEMHGTIIRDVKRKVSKILRQKIAKDSVEYLAQEYKIHLQPKPEYQFPVLRVLVDLLATDKEFNKYVDSWKAVIPYHRTKTELNLPVIVIYPVWGEKAAKIVLEKLVKAFDKYDSAKIGLNHTPRYNKKHNELIYYAGGSGDHKEELPESYFTKGKIFYKGHELKL